MCKYGLSDKTITSILNVFKQNKNIKKVKIFGSRAKGNYKDNSDIDLVIWGNATHLELEKIKMELEYLPTPYEFDLLNYDHITHKELKKHIDRVSKKIL